MTAGDDDRDLFLFLCRGLLDTECGRLTCDGARFGVIAESLPSGLASSHPVMVLDFSEAEFQAAVAQAETWASRLWPNRLSRQRGVQLMLVHADEGIATTSHAATTYIMALPGGNVTVVPGRRRTPKKPLQFSAPPMQQRRRRHVSGPHRRE